MSNEWAAFYKKELNLNDYLGNLYEHLYLFERIMKEKPLKTLEIGIGNGSMSIFLSHLGFKATGIDNEIKIVKKAMETNQNFNGNAHFIQCDAFELEKKFEGEFDVVFSQGFFEHFSDEEIRTLILKQLEVGKIVLFSVPSNFYPRLDLGNERLLSKEEWHNILDGLNVEYIEYYGNHPLPIKQLIKNIFKFPNGHSLKHFNTLVTRPYHLLIKIARK
jgi:hypothetical protein